MPMTGRKRTTSKADQWLVRKPFAPPLGYELELEVMSTAEMRRRATAGREPVPHRIDFHLLLAVTNGQCEHWVDFAAQACRPGSWLIVRPGQVFRFSSTSNWHGWMVLFRPQFLLPAGRAAGGRDPATVSIVENFVNHIQLSASEQETCVAGVEQIFRDCQHAEPGPEVRALLRHQLSTVLLRLRLARLRHQESVTASARSQVCFHRFREAVEMDFANTHQVGVYARRLGYSEKSLSRSTLESVGVTAKTYLSQRICLEAQRLLVHTTLPVSEVAAQLGTQDAANFVKFFKRWAGYSPTEFRHRHRGVKDTGRNLEERD